MPSLHPDYKAEEGLIEAFLLKYRSDFEDTESSSSSNSSASGKYMQMLHDIADRRTTRLEIDLDDVAAFNDSEEYTHLVHNILRNTKRYSQMFATAADSMMPAPSSSNTHDSDVIDVLIQQRLQREMDEKGKQREELDPRNIFPPALLRRYNVYFKRGGKNKALPVRAIKAQHVGSLITVRGIVTRATEVKPIIHIATYTCDKCGYEIYQEILSPKFTPLTQCQSEKCQSNNSRGRLFLQTRGSKFDKYQEFRLQEMADEVPVGSIPRSMTVKCYGDTVRQAKPGDLVTIQGIYLVTPYTGFRGIHAGLITDTYMEAMSVTQMKKQYTDYSLTEDVHARIHELARDAQVYAKLSQSIAPEIYGHDDVKKALLLLLVGGVTKSLPDGLRIRGDINILLMGDPGIAKSQLLKHISHLAPRGIYTTGKGSSGVGLTAALVRDPVSDEFVLEGGALVLADRGVCCIDEFDKMEEGDRTAIHEVMEQQTISISKAGITTTLNARTSILAAANPLYGRYNRGKSTLQNIDLPSALLSRFDLLFLLLDNANMEDDLRLAAHITYVHAHSTHPPLSFEPLDAHLMRQYVAQARQFEPVIPETLTATITEIYLGMRQQQRQRFSGSGSRGGAAADQGGSYITARSLLGILRLAQALARLRFSPEVAQADVQEAVRLVDMSKASLLTQLEAHPVKGAGGAATAAHIYQVVRDYHDQLLSLARAAAAEEEEEEESGVAAREGSDRVMHSVDLPYEQLRERVLQRGFKEKELIDALHHFEQCDVLLVSQDRSAVRFL